MDYKIESEVYNQLGVAIVEQLGSSDLKILVYVEMDEGGLDYIVRFSKDEESSIRGVFAGTGMKLALATLEDYVFGLPLERRWRAMEYVVDYRQLEIILSYDEIDSKVPIWKRTPSLLEKHFPGKAFQAK